VLSLYLAYPNPFNPQTTIRFDLPREQRVRLVVYSVKGQQVQVLRDRSLPAGRYSVVWDGCDGRGRPVSSGVYVYRLEAEQGALTQKMTLIR
jgi:flagellar hook assembly protein FlgD